MKLSFPYGTQARCTLAQFSRTLQKHPNLRELDLKDGATPQESPGVPVPFTLPQLVDLQLRGTVGCISGLTNLIGMSSPLRTVALHFCYPNGQNVPALVDATKRIIAAYYECEGLDHPRKASHLTVLGSGQGPLTFLAQPRSGPEPTLELRFSRMDHLLKIFPLFPLKDTRDFTIEGVVLSSKEHYTILRKMRGLLRLNVSGVQINPVLEALNPRNRGLSKGATEVVC